MLGAGLVADVAQVVADTIQALTRRSVDPATYPNDYRLGAWCAPGQTATRDLPALGRAAANLAAWPGCPAGLRADMLVLAGHGLEQALASASTSMLPAPVPGQAADVDARIGLSNAAEIVLRVGGDPAPLVALGAAMWAAGGVGPASWYVNGNAELSEALCYWLLFRLTGDQVWRDRFSSQWSYALNPTVGTTQGPTHLSDYGYRRTGTRPAPGAPDGTWADAIGYLGEAIPGGTPGFDGDYSTYHLEILGRLLVATDGYPEQARVVKLANALTNTLLALTNTTTTMSAAGIRPWFFDGRGGVRHPNVVTQLRAPTLWFLIGRGMRPDLDPGWPAASWQLALRPFWTNGSNEVHPPYDGSLYGRLADLSTVLLT